METTQVYYTILHSCPPGIQTALVPEIKHKHLLTAQPRRISSPGSALRPRGRCETPRTHCGRDSARQPPHPARTDRLSQPSFCPGWTFLLALLLPSWPPLQPQLPPFPPDPTGNSRRRGGTAVRSRRPARSPQRRGRPSHDTMGGARAAGAPPPGSSCVGASLGQAGFGTRVPEVCSRKCFPAGRKARSPSVLDVDGTLPRTSKG